MMVMIVSDHYWLLISKFSFYNKDSLELLCLFLNELCINLICGKNLERGHFFAVLFIMIKRDAKP